ncbi:HD domain-containing protein [Roseomonas stagni]|uniref:HD domain-containing protein n=1 Tax=Falsiroseomonas algicola TaxID=2716930 RepID=A0A6M1LJN9_9PROT|nr:HD domain-containing phosphohydrolase [Falsiroseomonas algicola]NGM20387.1 HD domain-containing protein [Falsiroseomonas algicola]
MEPSAHRAESTLPGKTSHLAAVLDEYPQRDAVMALLGRLRDHHPASVGHSVRVAQALHAMALEGPAYVGDVATAMIAGLLHDIGKLRVPPATLDSERGLDKVSLDLIRAHPEAGAAILAEAGLPPVIIDVARGHHERWRGGGYPGGLPATAQPPLARAVAVADALVAMVEPGRPYRKPLPRDAALLELETCAGLHFDPEATAILIAAASRRHGGLDALLGA